MKNFSGFDGTVLEDFYSNLTGHEADQLDFYDSRFKCKPCSKGCETCVGKLFEVSFWKIWKLYYFHKKCSVDDGPCESEVSHDVKLVAVSINIACICLCLILLLFTWYHMKLQVGEFFSISNIFSRVLYFSSTFKVLKTSSPKMLFMVLFGAIISYMEVYFCYAIFIIFWSLSLTQNKDLIVFYLKFIKKNFHVGL